MAALLRSCLHCALGRALEAEAEAFRARGLELRLSRSDPVFLPMTGARLYRELRHLLRAARAAAERGPVKLSVLDLCGKSHVEVTVTVPRGRGSQVLGCAFPHHDPVWLPRGFDEHAGSD